LNNIETKYFNFLDPGLVGSIMEIQDSLLKLSMLSRIEEKMRWLGMTDDQYFTEVTTEIHNIVKEIYEIDTKGMVRII
jgi:hypothetical protein